MNGTNALTAVGSNRVLRFIHLAFCLSLIGIMSVVEYVRDPETISSGTLHVPFLGFGVVLVGMLFFMRSKIGVIEAALILAPHDRTSLAKRHQLYIVLFAVSEAVVLLGCVLRFTGASLPQSVPFYAAGLFLILLSTPRKLD